MNGIQQACRNSAGKCFTNTRSTPAIPPTRHHLPSCGRCMEGYQEKDPQTGVSQGAPEGPSAGQKQAFPAIPRRTASLSKIVCCFRVVLKKPEHTPLHCSQNPHPAVKGRRSDFVVVVETAEHKSRFRQAPYLPAKNLLGNAAFCVVHLIAVGKIGYFFRVVRLTAFGYKRLISNQIIDILRTHGTGIA